MNVLRPIASLGSLNRIATMSSSSAARLFDPVRLVQKAYPVNVTLESKHPESAKTAVVFITKDEIKAKDLSRVAAFGVQVPDEFFEDFTGKANATRVLYGSAGGVTRVVLVGLGSAKRIDHQSLRMAVHSSISALRELKVKDAALYVPADLAKQHADLLVRNAITSSHKFDKYMKNCARTDSAPFNSLSFVVDQVDESITQRARLVAQSVMLCRELQGERADVCNPDFMQHIAEQMVAQSNGALRLDIYDEAKLEELGLTLIRAVGQAAKSRPRILVLSYFGRPDTTEEQRASGQVDLCVVGKGITYDTGGLDLKPSGSMNTMHLDMSVS